MNYIEIHKKWREYWKANNTNAYDPKSKKPKHYALCMFPYPSGANLHMGHFYNFAPVDTHARFMRMCGYNVFHPMGFDAFGLPAENHALKSGTHPKDNTIVNMQKFVGQLEELGGMYDWNYTVNTCFPDYYRWTQWIFVQLFNAGLAYQKDALVNWCDKCKTVIANEQIIDGECERCSETVIRKQMKQWFFKITAYADRLLKGLDDLDWPSKTKAMQRNWIGKSEGANILFDNIEVFTTRIDTIFGGTFLVIAPEHRLTPSLIKPEHSKACQTYIDAAAKKSEIERQEVKVKTGVFTGSHVTNPATGEKVPVYIADYVLATYGTGAVMGVPAHDERDREFAEKFGLEIRDIPLPPTPAQQKIIDRVGTPCTTYRLRDWGFGRQRYWGCPIPIVHCDDCGAVAVPQDQLPVELPYITDFTPKGDAPLASHPEFINTICPKCGKPAKREAETMDTFVCSSWYFLRYPDAALSTAPFNPKTTNAMLPVDVYVGGAEHACMHLLYARFFTMFLHDEGYLNFTEPFPRLVHQGVILAKDGTKMSKSKGNTISPDEYTAEFGSDILRLHMMFGYNYVDGGAWNDEAIKTITRFTARIHKLVTSVNTPTESDPEVLYVRANTIKSVREDLQTLNFNTAVARCMELVNAIYASKQIARDTVSDLVLCVAPLIPHLGEEFWELLGNKPSVFDQPFPQPNAKHLTKSTIEIAVQISSKIVARINVPSNATQAQVEKLCVDILAGKTPKKVIYVAGKLINFIC